jgi:ubiquinone/menaquinone biosynthesis C-methylase UbiE
MSKYSHIKIAGGDTATRINLSKRCTYIGKFLMPGQSRVIDCGCGEGNYVLALMKTFSVNVSGIEYQKEKVLQAHKIPELKSRIIQGDIEHIPYPDNHFDVAILNEVIEHVPDERKTLSEIYRILKPNGIIIIFAPNKWFPFETHGVNLRGHTMSIPLWVPFIPYIPMKIGNKIFDYWARNYWQSEILNLVQSSHFLIIERSWLWQTFENISGKQPFLLHLMKPFLRITANIFESIPVIKRFGVSQVIVARKDH